VGGGAHGPGNEAAVVHAALAPPGEQAGALEDAQMLRDRRQRHAKRLRELADGRVGRRGELREDRAPRRVGERLERRIERRATRIVNHMVNYYARARLCQALCPSSRATARDPEIGRLTSRAASRSWDRYRR